MSAPRDPAFPAPDPERSLSGLIRLALSEDIGPGDWTTRWTVPGDQLGRARIVAKEDLVVSGVAAASAVFSAVDPGLEVAVVCPEGSRASEGSTVMTVEGRLAAILTAERTALNFLGFLGGVATLTRRFVEAVRGTGARIVDTRKTPPGWRALSKRAVVAGGGANHRMGLYDMVLVKDNHIAAAGGVAEAVARVREANDRALGVEVEVVSLEQLEGVLAAGVDRVMLDNMDLAELRAAVERVRQVGEGRPQTEASGNVDLDTVRAIAETGVDLISVGALTHSARSVDLSLRVEW